MMNMLGLGKKTKSQIVWRQISLIIAFSICNAYLIFAVIVHNGCQFKGLDCFHNQLFSWYGTILGALFYAQGLIFALTRMLEPGQFRLHLGLAQKLFCCKTDVLIEEKIEPINLHFNSTLNIEFVYVILDGIIKFSHTGLDKAYAS